MSVLFGFSKKETVSHNSAFFMAAVTVASMSLFLLCIVRNPKVKLHNESIVEE